MKILEGFSEKSGFRSVAFPERCRILPGFSGKWRVALQKSKNWFTARDGRPPARPPARCTVPTASRSHVRWCLTCRGAPHAPRGDGATANPHPAPLGAKSFQKVALQPQNFEAEKSGSKFFRISCPMAQSPGRKKGTFEEKGPFSEATERH